MTAANVEIVREGYEAFNRGDLDAAIERFDPQIEWIPLKMLPEHHAVRRPEGVREWWRMWQEVFGGFRLEVEEVIDAGDQVVVMSVILGTGQESGAAVSTPRFAQVWTLRDGHAVRMEMFQTKGEALAAAGLSRQR